MSTNPQQLQQKAPSFKQVDASIRTLTMEMEKEKGVLPGEENPNTPFDRLGRLVTIYNGIKPLLSVLATLALIPSTWRAAMSLFIAALQAVADGATSPDFKAGKDL